jgi:hypothetical protein
MPTAERQTRNKELFYFSEAEEFCRFDLRAEHDRPLESADVQALRTHSAGPTMIATSFSDEAKEFPPSAASAKAFRAQALTSTVLL